MFWKIDEAGNTTEPKKNDNISLKIKSNVFPASLYFTPRTSLAIKKAINEPSETYVSLWQRK